MSVDDAKQAMDRRYGVKHIGESEEHWGTISALSDDETTAYIKPHGMGLLRTSCEVKDLELAWPWSKRKEKE